MLIRTVLELPFSTNAAYKNLLFGLAIALGLFLGTPEPANAEPDYGGSVSVAVELDSWGFDAIKARGLTVAGAGGISANLIMERLFEQGKDGELIPALGLSATPSEDGKFWTIKLRQGVSFHDGTPFNADAVVSHWQRLLDPKNRYRGSLVIKPVQSIKKIDDFTVRFHLKHHWLSFGSILSTIRSFTPLIPSPTAVAADTQNRHPVGTGPFVFKKWKSKDRIVVTKNQNYWQEGKPYLDQIVIRNIPDHETRLAAASSGQVDIIMTDRPTHIKKLQNNKGINTSIGGGAGAIILALNTNKPPLDDIRVRQAIAHAFDQEQYIKISYDNTMPPAEHFFGDTCSCGDMGYRKPDIAKAKELIADYGKPVEVEYVHSPTQRGKEAGEILRRLMGQIGIKVTPKPLDFGGIMKHIFSKQYNIASWIVPGSDDMSPASMAAFHSKSPWNVTRYNNPKVDTLLAKQQSTTDRQEQKDILCQIAKKINEDVPFIYLNGRKYYSFWANKIQGVPPARNGLLRLSNAWIEQKTKGRE